MYEAILPVHFGGSFYLWRTIFGRLSVNYVCEAAKSVSEVFRRCRKKGPRLEYFVLGVL